ncbi:calpain-A-like [Haemaphysalis longicornis]
MSGRRNQGAMVYKFGQRFSGTRSRRGSSQDYRDLLQQCLERGQLFRDPEFPCTQESVFGQKRPRFDVVWKRPFEITDVPAFVTEGFSRFDAQQGSLGNCWVVASISSLTLHEDLFNSVVPQGQSFAEGEYAGIFHFRLWKANRWIDVVVDDRLPYSEDHGCLVFMTSSTTHEFWSALLEKAYAKLHGGYASLEGGTGAEALETLTGGIAEEVRCESIREDFFNIVRKALERKSLITCSITREGESAEGLVGLHEYSVTGAEKVYVEEDEVSLIRIRNPHGPVSGEWRGAWSDGSSEWAAIDEEQRDLFGLVVREDGEFWISEEDFLQHFHLIDICHLDPRSLTREDSDEGGQRMWQVAKFEGSWVPGFTAGGSGEWLYTNPQYMVTLHEPAEDDVCTVIVALLQKNRRWLQSHDEMWLPIGFSVYQVEDPDSCPRPLTDDQLNGDLEVGRCEQYTQCRQVTRRLRLPPGNFCIVPATYHADEPGDFLLRIYTDTASSCREHDEDAADVRERLHAANGVDEEAWDVAGDEVECETNEELRDAFDEYASDDETINSVALKAVLANLTPPGGSFLDFPLDVCRSMVALVDDDYTGTLTFKEFSHLYKFIEELEDTFTSDENYKGGHVSADNLRSLLRTAGYSVNQHTLKILALRCGRKKRIFLPDFIGFAVKLKYMTGVYDHLYPDEEQRAALSLNEWLTCTMYC